MGEIGIDDDVISTAVDRSRNATGLVEAIAQTFDDPLEFVYLNWTWGEGSLEGQDGPDRWQVQILTIIRDYVRAGMNPATAVQAALQVAVSSGHGIGKTACIAWIIIWFMSTRERPFIVVTANTKTQLETKTWRELSKWHAIARNKSWFTWTATKFYLTGQPENWFASAVPWSKERKEAFAGTHEANVLMIFDEGSAIDDEIWGSADGAMTTEGAMWVVFGNPTRNTGRFRACFTRMRHRWRTIKVDSRTAKMTNKEQLQQWVEDYGEDSDFVRVRVRGEFPRAASTQLIGVDLVEDAMARGRKQDWKLAEDFPLLIGVDIARFGDDQTVAVARRGNCCRVIKKWRDVDTMQTSAYLAEILLEEKPTMMFIDMGSFGAAVFDRLQQLGFHNVTGVNFGDKALEERKYSNKRAEMWLSMRDWLRGGGCLPPDDTELRDDLIGPEYGFDGSQRYQLERKEDMKSRGLPSPDTADALATTFAEKVAAPETQRQMGAVARALAGVGSSGVSGVRSWMSR